MIMKCCSIEEYVIISNGIYFFSYMSHFWEFLAHLVIILKHTLFKRIGIHYQFSFVFIIDISFRVISFIALVKRSSGFFIIKTSELPV